MRTRRYIPESNILVPLLEQLLETFTSTDENGISKFVDPVTLAPLFNVKAIQEFKKLIPHVKKGCLSDCIDIPLYYKLKVDSTSGLMMYRCVRGTSSIEGGIHQKVHENRIKQRLFKNVVTG